jgi:endonuclease/exonuclease/phosphatase family metal-dependent hydrolase
MKVTRSMASPVRLLLVLALGAGLAVTAAPGAAQAAEPTLSVMTFNVAGGACTATGEHAKLSILQEINLAVDIRARFETGVDVFVLQELFRDQAEFITDHLQLTRADHLRVVTTKTCEGNDQYGNPLGSRVNAVISRFSIDDSLFHTFNAQESDDGDQRGMVGASFLVDGRRVWAFSTHLTASGPRDSENSRIRALQAAELSDTAETKNPPNSPFRSIIGGDFNDQPPISSDLAALTSDDPYAVMSERYKDEWLEAHPLANDGPTSVGNTETRTNPTKRIDYIWRRLGSLLSLNSTSVLHPLVYFKSDHLAVSSSFDVVASSD